MTIHIYYLPFASIFGAATVLRISSIKVFDLKKFVRETKKQGMENTFNELPPLSNPFPSMLNEGNKNIDDLLKKIDDKIEELDAQEKQREYKRYY